MIIRTERIVDMAVVIADIHVGHPAAPWPEYFETTAGNVIRPNEAQQVLGQYWNEFWNEPDVVDAQYVINLEESIEGYNRKEHGHSIMVTDLNEQIWAFKQLIKPHIKDKIYIGVEGSKYHGSEDMQVGKIICDDLGGTYFGHIGNIQLKESGKIFTCMHKGSGAMMYKSAALDRKSLYMSAIKTRIGWDPDVILTAHHHQYFGTNTNTRKSIMAPCWKFWHPIKDASKYEFTQPSIGGLVIKVMESGRIRIDDYLYPLEHVYDALTEV